MMHYCPHLRNENCVEVFVKEKKKATVRGGRGEGVFCVGASGKERG